MMQEEQAEQSLRTGVSLSRNSYQSRLDAGCRLVAHLGTADLRAQTVPDQGEAVFEAASLLLELLERMRRGESRSMRL